MQKKLLAVFAHPDDESFGPGGTLAKYAKEGVEIELLCVTKGEGGRKKVSKYQGIPPPPSLTWLRRINKVLSGEELTSEELSDIRCRELMESARVIGIKKVEFLDFIDGKISNDQYHSVADKISAKIKEFKPQVVLTYENLGVSGHLDHIAVSLITTYSFIKQKIAQKLYYYCIPDWRARLFKRYFIYFPPGYSEEEITTKIDYGDFWDIKVKAMSKHKSQLKDVRRIIRKTKVLPKVDNFLLFNRDGEKILEKEFDFWQNIY